MNGRPAHWAEKVVTAAPRPTFGTQFRACLFAERRAYETGLRMRSQADHQPARSPRVGDRATCRADARGRPPGRRRPQGRDKAGRVMTDDELRDVIVTVCLLALVVAGVLSYWWLR